MLATSRIVPLLDEPLVRKVASASIARCISPSGLDDFVSLLNDIRPPNFIVSCSRMCGAYSQYLDNHHCQVGVAFFHFQLLRKKISSLIKEGIKLVTERCVKTCLGVEFVIQYYAGNYLAKFLDGHAPLQSIKPDIEIL